MSRVVHFEISADDPARALSFSRARPGLEGRAVGRSGLLVACHRRRRGAGYQRRGRCRWRENWPAIVNTLDVASLADTVAAVVANGGKVIEAWMVVPGVGYLAYCLDTEGNAFGLMQSDPNVMPDA